MSKPKLEPFEKFLERLRDDEDLRRRCIAEVGAREGDTAILTVVRFAALQGYGATFRGVLKALPRLLPLIGRGTGQEATERTEERTDR